METTLVPVSDRDSWSAYHAIRRDVLFERRGIEGYNDNHPDEYRIGHVPLLFCLDGMPIGTVRLDLSPNEGGSATVRLVAIVQHYQRQGFGKAMMAALEHVAIARGVRRLTVHAAPDAVGFYRTIGFQIVDCDRDNPLLVKIIA